MERTLPLLFGDVGSIYHVEVLHLGRELLLDGIAWPGLVPVIIVTGLVPALILSRDLPGLLDDPTVLVGVSGWLLRIPMDRARLV